MSLPALYNDPTITGYYDFLELFYKRSLNSVVNNSILVISDDTLGTVEYQVSSFNTPDIKIFDATNYNNVAMITPISYNNGVVRYQDNINFANPKQYWIIGGNNYNLFLLKSRIKIYMEQLMVQVS